MALPAESGHVFILDTLEPSRRIEVSYVGCFSPCIQVEFSRHSEFITISPFIYDAPTGWQRRICVIYNATGQLVRTEPCVTTSHTQEDAGREPTALT